MTTVRSCDHTNCQRAATTLVEFTGCHGSYCDPHTALVYRVYQIMHSRPLTAQEKNTPHRHKDAA